jgi:hypothetical protein
MIPAPRPPTPPGWLRPLLVIGRRVVGTILLIIGILGWLLPILPGWPFVIPAIVLLGRRDPLLRRMHLVLRLGLRSLRRTRHPRIRRLGLRLLDAYQRARATVVPAIDATERALERFLV